MRTTKDQQDRTRRALLQAASELMVQQGLDATSMKHIARAAGVGDATIYHYFASKEQLLLGFMAQQVDDALVQWRATPELAEFGLQEQLQSLVDAVLHQLLGEREFVALVMQHLQGSLSSALWGQALPGRVALAAAFAAVLEGAVARGEIAAPAFSQALGALLADYTLGVVVFWLRDSSPHFGDTTRLVDLSLELVVLVLRTGLIGKLLDLGGFVLRNQMARLLQPGSQALDWLSLLRGGLQAAAHAPTPPAYSAPPPDTRKTANAADAAVDAAPRKASTRAAPAPRRNRKETP